MKSEMTGRICSFCDKKAKNEGGGKENGLLLINLSMISPDKGYAMWKPIAQSGWESTFDVAWNAAKADWESKPWGSWTEPIDYARTTRGECAHDSGYYQAQIITYKYKFYFDLRGYSAPDFAFLSIRTAKNVYTIENIPYWGVGAIDSVTTSMSKQTKEADKAELFGDVSGFFGSEINFEFHDIYAYGELDNLKPPNPSTEPEERNNRGYRLTDVRIIYK